MVTPVPQLEYSSDVWDPYHHDVGDITEPEVQRRAAHRVLND